MNFSEALKKGYIFTGAAWSASDAESGQYYRDLARKLKIKYNANYKVVSGSRGDWLGIGNKAIVGDANFNRLWDLTRRDLKGILKSIPDRLKKAEDDYKAQVKKIEQLKKSVEDDIAFMKSLERTK